MSAPVTNTGLFVSTTAICALLAAQLGYQVHRDQVEATNAAMVASQAQQSRDTAELLEAWHKATEGLASEVDGDLRKLARNESASADWVVVKTYNHGDVRRKGNLLEVSGFVRASKGDAELWWKWERETRLLDDGTRHAGPMKLTGIQKPDSTGWLLRALKTPRL
jgi:hypothetical protein